MNTQLHLSLCLIFCFSLQASFSKNLSENEVVKFALQCSEEELPLRVRTEKSLDVGCIKISSLKNLSADSHCFEGAFFKIVHDKNSDPICFNDWKNLNTKEDILRIIRATTVYTSLTRAKEYFDTHTLFSSKTLFETYPLIIRVDQTSKYDSDKRYNLEVEEKNNALTIGPSSFEDSFETEDGSVLDPWHKEINFSQPKFLKIKGNIQRVGEVLRKRNVKNIIMYPIYMEKAFESVQELTYALTNDFYKKYFYHPQTHLYSIAVTQLFVELLPELIIQPGKLFKRSIRLDTAMFPEVSYHEYVHIVLGDYFHYAQYTLLNESIAHYYATQISGFNSLLVDNKYDNKGYNIVSANFKSKEKYSLDYLFDKSSVYSSFGLTVIKEWENIIGKNLLETLVSSTISKINDPYGEISLEKFLTLLREELSDLPGAMKEKVISSWKTDRLAFSNESLSYSTQHRMIENSVNSLRKERLYNLNPEDELFFEQLYNILNLELVHLANKRGL